LNTVSSLQFTGYLLLAYTLIFISVGICELLIGGIQTGNKWMESAQRLI